MQLFPIKKDKELIYDITSLYVQAWGNLDTLIYDRFLKHTTYPGYRGYYTKDDKGEIIGFCYGYSTAPGQYYRGLLENDLTVDEKEKRLSDCFEFVELAVHPNHHKQGIGEMLASHLLRNAPNKTSILTTQATNTPALQLYEKLNYKLIHDCFYPNNSGEAFVIMGKELE